MSIALWVAAPAAGSETEWQSMQVEGCVATLPWNAPVCQSVAAMGVVEPLANADGWQVWQVWNVSCVEPCFIVKLVPLLTSALVASAMAT